jgi:hypothetical protein
MSKNAMAGAVTLCGVGLCVIGAALMMQNGNSAHAAGGMPLAAVAAVAHAQAAPTVVWMGVTQWSGEYSFYRLWSDGRLEKMSIYNGINPGWHEVPPPPGGNGFACRADMNGDRLVDGADLGIMLNAWGQQGGCEPDATYPCLDLGNLAGAVASK